MSAAGAPAGAAPERDRDPFDARIALGAAGALAEFNRAGVLSAADVHVARRLGALAGEQDEAVLLAVALAVRAPRLGHVLVDLQTIRETAAVDGEEAVDLAELHWPEDPAAWAAAVAGSPLVADAVAPLRLEGSALYLDRYWGEEVGVARSLRAMLERPADDGGLAAPGLDATLARLFPDAPQGLQAAGARAAATRRLTVLAGGPGTGKTTTVGKIVALLCEQSGGALPLIALAAPTGKAAARLQEAVHAQAPALDVSETARAALLSLEASTIHRLLGWRPGSSSRFAHDRTRRLPHDVVIVDETSMVSLSLMSRLTEALRSDARLVLVGDPGQLTSIEAGAVLGDIVDAPAARASDAVVVLEQGHRFGGGIAELAAAIRGGDADEVMERLDTGRVPPLGGGGAALMPERGVVWVDADGASPAAAARVRSVALRGAEAVLTAAAGGEGAAALHALSDVRILCAHRRGPYGVAAWTARVEGWLEESASGFSAGERWYVGRPLLVTENDYELGLYNGDTGVVTDAGDGRVQASFERGGEVVGVSPSRLGAVDTVHAMTIHKSQGSQFGTAVVLLPEPGSRLLTRELLYTAATRAVDRLVLVGPQETIRAAVGRRVARASGLAGRLWG